MILEMQKTIQVIYEKFHLQKCWLSFSHILDLEREVELIYRSMNIELRSYEGRTNATDDDTVCPRNSFRLTVTGKQKGNISSQGFHECTKLAILSLILILYCHVIAISFFISK